ncbi:MAG: TonB family protein [Reichenbachiella sp.]|uniref:energy transducer TonB n=1 Tax=Reichenbachiella sp. TaxID=2184521 RepID=UPI0032631D96
MEATIENLIRPTQRMSKANQKKSKTAKNTEALPTRENAVIHLNVHDYEDLIAWKRAKADAQKNNSTMFFFIGLALALGMVITAFEWNFEKGALVKDLLVDNTEWEEVQDIPLTSQPPPPPPMQVIQQPVIVEVPDEEILEEVEVNMDVETTEDMAVEEVEFVMELPEEKAEEIFLLVEDKPEPKGGIKAFYKYVADNIRYPREATENRVEGRVYVQFVVNSQGKISDVEAVKGIGAGCDEEAARIVNEAPDWNPGKQRGKPVSVRMVLPITFKLFLR